MSRAYGGRNNNGGIAVQEERVWTTSQLPV